MAAMSNKPPSLARLCLCGAMITSNGWLDVLLYTVTRRIMIFSDEPPPDNNGIDTFSAFWSESGKRFGAACTIEADPSNRPQNRKPARARGIVTLPSKNDSVDDLCDVGDKDIKMVTTTHIFSEPAQPADYAAMEEEERKNRPRTPTGRWSEESANFPKEMELAHIPD
jgi:hypothetical protein